MGVIGTSVRKATEEDKERVVDIMGDDKHMFDNMAPKDMYKLLKEAGADVLMSGGRSQFVALTAKMPWVDVNQEKHEPYAGYMGMVDLVYAIDRAVNNPMWAELREPAPWDEPLTAGRVLPPISGECPVTGTPAGMSKPVSLVPPMPPSASQAEPQPVEMGGFVSSETDFEDC